MYVVTGELILHPADDGQDEASAVPVCYVCGEPLGKFGDCESCLRAAADRIEYEEAIEREAQRH